MIFLLLVMVVYLLFTQQDTGEKEQDLAAATEEMPAETDTEKELKTTESLAVYESYAYVIKQKDGILVVYQSDGITEFFETNIRIRDLNEDMVKKLENGTLIYYSTAGLIFKKRSYDFLKNTCIQYKF